MDDFQWLIPIQNRRVRTREGHAVKDSESSLTQPQDESIQFITLLKIMQQLQDEISIKLEVARKTGRARMQIEQKINVKRAKNQDRDTVKEQRNTPSAIEIRLDHHHNGSPCAQQNLQKKPKKTQYQETRRKVKKSRVKPKEWINSVKVNIIRVNPTFPGFKYYGDNRPGGYQMVNRHQQAQYENNNYRPDLCFRSRVRSMKDFYSTNCTSSLMKITYYHPTSQVSNPVNLA